MIKGILYATIQWSIMVLIRLPLILLGLIVVPIALPFRRTELRYKDGQPFEHVDLPGWAWLWSNERNGALGDQRGWWDANTPFGDSRSFMSMFWWLAIRNPVNNMRFTSAFSCNTEVTHVEVLAGNNVVDDGDDRRGFGWQFLRGTADGSGLKRYYCFRFVGFEWGSERVFDIELGHKIKLDHNEKYYHEGENQKAWKGFTFVINPFLKFKE